MIDVHPDTQGTGLGVSTVIPTKNRPDDLETAVRSLLSQTRPPDELIVVDQSSDTSSRDRIHALFKGIVSTQLSYIHDTAITGLVHAKRVGAERARFDIVCFLEDDVVLEPEYVAEVIGGFRAQPDMLGCSGVITNPPSTSTPYSIAHALFFRGIFRDPRVRIFAKSPPRAGGLVRCDVLSGGLSSWRKRVFQHVTFDMANGFFMFEDMEFSTRVARALGTHLYVNPRARLEHRGSAVNRDIQGVRQQRKMTEVLAFYKKRRGWRGAWTGVAGVMAWYFAEASLQSIRFRSSKPLQGYVRGVIFGLQKTVVS